MGEQGSTWLAKSTVAFGKPPNVPNRSQPGVPTDCQEHDKVLWAVAKSTRKSPKPWFFFKSHKFFLAFCGWGNDSHVGFLLTNFSEDRLPAIGVLLLLARKWELQRGYLIQQGRDWIGEESSSGFSSLSCSKGPARYALTSKKGWFRDGCALEANAERGDERATESNA